MSTVLVLGARNLGGAVARRFAERGDRVATLSLSEETAESVRETVPGALALTGDAADAGRLQEVLEEVSSELGGPDVIVNAVSPRSGGPSADEIVEAPADALDRYTGELLPAVFQFLRVGGGWLAERGSGTLIQVTGGSARQAIAGRGPWAAAAHATRALTQVAALELRERGVHVALLIIDARIATGEEAREVRAENRHGVALHDDILPVLETLVDQSPRAWSHEVVVTPRAERWAP